MDQFSILEKNKINQFSKPIFDFRPHISTWKCRYKICCFDLKFWNFFFEFSPNFSHFYQVFRILTKFLIFDQVSNLAHVFRIFTKCFEFRPSFSNYDQVFQILTNFLIFYRVFLSMTMHFEFWSNFSNFDQVFDVWPNFSNLVQCFRI